MANKEYLGKTGATYLIGKVVTLLNAKADASSLKKVATSGSYNDLDNKPTIPSTTSSVTQNSSAALTSGGAYTALNAKAPLASPNFSGTPTAPTAASGTNSTQVATTAFVNTAIGNAIGEMTGVEFKVVDTLPTNGVTGNIYLVSNGGSNGNSYDEYIWVNTRFEKIGTTDVDLSGYQLSSELVEIENTEIDAMFS